MAKNLIPQIAKMLGVELGEEFKVKDEDALTYRFTDDGLKVTYDGGIEISNISTNSAFINLVNGTDEIIKLSWKPKKGETYYTFDLLGDKWAVRPSCWGGFPNEYALLDKGWVYRSQAEAQAALPKVAAEMGVEININRALTAVEKAWLAGIVSRVLLEEELKELQEQRKGAK